MLERYLGHKKAIEVVEELADMTEIIGTTKKEIVQALKNNFKDYEDSIQYSSALTIKGVEAIITRNVKDYRISKIAVLTPLNYLKMKEKTRADKY